MNSDVNTSEAENKLESNEAADDGVSKLVANHYNKLEEKGLHARKESRIYFLRNFNNWIKSMIIAETLDKIREKWGDDYRINVLDIGCGKGGDLLKYKVGRISHIICADIAEVSVKQCEERFNEMMNSRRGGPHNRFTAEFITADCTRENLLTKFSDPSLKCDLVSIQFSFHYCFESMTQANCMIKNASMALRTGGYLIGTTTNAYEIIKRMRKLNSREFGNDVYSIKLSDEFQDESKNIPLFGAKYDFHLEGVVDCPEFLVYFPAFEEIAKKHGLKLIYCQRFPEYFLNQKNNVLNKNLLNRMDSLEGYPPLQDKQLVGDAERDYNTVKEFLKNSSDGGEHKQIGTLSLSEWEAACLYVVFVFEKVFDNNLVSMHKKMKL